MENEKQALIEELKGLLEQNVSEIKEQVEDVKSRFYRVYHQELETVRKAAQEAADAAGETMENWVPPFDEAEQQMRQLLATYKEKRREASQKLEEEMAQNLLRKENIIEQMKKMAQNETGDVMNDLKIMRELQAEWKTIGPVPAPKAQEIWKQYQLWQEQFYDLVKINIELRDLDFKKNLEMKTLLCEAAEKLQENENVVEAGRALQQLHNEWAEIGPVARELREDLWNRFKAASTVINKKHQAYFDALHEKEQENLKLKQEIIEQIKAIHPDELKTARQWNEAQQTLQGLQEEWRKVGFAPRKQNQAIYDEYRTLCNSFFKARAAFFKDMRDELGGNLKAKRALIDKANELLSQEAWQQGAQAMIDLQKEWKTIGPVARKLSDELWQQFTAICDTFFEKKREADKSARGERDRSRSEKALQSNDRQRLMRMYENLQQEIKTAENNILFFTGKSKNANQLVEDMQKNIDRNKEQLKAIEEKINALDNAEQQPEA